MRFKLHLRPVKDHQKLTFNYQYAIHSWIYKLLANIDKGYADFLHNEGYKIENEKKSFKHFTFSSLKLGRIKPIYKGDDAIILSTDIIELVISFYMDKAAKNFILGLFKSQNISLCTTDYKADFIIEKVENLVSHEFQKSLNNTTIKFNTISPLVIGRKVEGINTDEYISPTHPEFSKMFAFNLVHKYMSVQNNILMNIDMGIAENLINFKLISNPNVIREMKFSVKESDNQRTTKVVGFHNFQFEVTGPEEIIEVGYLGGFGRHSSIGCGCAEIIN